MGDDHRPCDVSDGRAFDLGSILRDVIASTEMLLQKTAEPLGGTQPAALPSSPIRAVFLDGIRRVVETSE
jgi:hypothetical protein